MREEAQKAALLPAPSEKSVRSMQMQEILLQNQWDKIPSHGWGRRFNPCTAHQKPASFQHFLKSRSAQVGTSRQNMARTGTIAGEKSVSFVRGVFTHGEAQ